LEFDIDKIKFDEVEGAFEIDRQIVVDLQARFSNSDAPILQK
jgi:hypothetical protein